MNILSVENKGGKLVAIIGELDVTVTGGTVDELYEGITEVVNEYTGSNDSILKEISVIDKEVTELLARRDELEDRLVDDPVVATMLDPTDARVYKSVLKVLTDDTSVEKAIGRPVSTVVFVPDDDGNIYRTKFTWWFYFGRYFGDK